MLAVDKAEVQSGDNGPLEKERKRDPRPRPEATTNKSMREKQVVRHRVFLSSNLSRVDLVTSERDANIELFWWMLLSLEATEGGLAFMEMASALTGFVRRIQLHLPSIARRGIKQSTTLVPSHRHTLHLLPHHHRPTYATVLTPFCPDLDHYRRAPLRTTSRARALV